MGLLQSMDTARLGLVGHQQRLDNISNNLANVDTTGFKKTQHQFQSVFSKQLSAGQASTGTRGSVNPLEVGLGSSTSAIDPVFTQGPLQSTGDQHDIAIEGNGYFVVRYDAGLDTADYAFTRDGNFYLHSNTMTEAQDLYFGSGMSVQGYMADENGVLPLVQDGTTMEGLSIPIGKLRAGEQSTEVSILGNLDSRNEPDDYAGHTTSKVEIGGNFTGDTDLVFNIYEASMTTLPNGEVREVVNAVPCTMSLALNSETATGSLYDWTSTDGATGQAWFDTNGAFVSQTQSAKNDIDFDFTQLMLSDVGDGLKAWDVNGKPTGSYTRDIEVYDSLTEIADDGTATEKIVKRNITMIYTQVDKGAGYTDWTWEAEGAGGASGTIRFNENGNIESDADGNLIGFTQDIAGDITFSMGDMTQIAASGTVTLQDQDGYPESYMKDFTITNDGIIHGVYDTGEDETIGRVALARIPNDEGMTRLAGNLYQANSMSGDASYGAPEESGFGRVRSGMLEGSNVDLAQETTNMILTQRGFQANARVITTSNELLQELVRLKQ